MPANWQNTWIWLGFFVLLQAPGCKGDNSDEISDGGPDATGYADTDMDIDVDAGGDADTDGGQTSERPDTPLP